MGLDSWLITLTDKVNMYLDPSLRALKGLFMDSCPLVVALSYLCN